ncbi:MAG: alpha/beta fold hydrolase [Aggregatilineales bacterium]
MQPAGFIRRMMTFMGGLIILPSLWSRLLVDHDMPLHPAIDAERKEFYGTTSTRLSYYVDTRGEGQPLVLIHSINAAGNACEMKPIFDHYAGTRPVYALDLPGFGFSERSQREYSPDLYCNAIMDFMTQVVGEKSDAIALSLGSEFLAMAALNQPEMLQSATMISPSGLTQRDKKVSSQRAADEESDEGIYKFLSNPLWAQTFYDLLTTKPSIYFFLSQSFAGETNRDLAEYGYLMTHQPGARYAPLYFVSGRLFTSDIFEQAYEKLTIPAMILYDRDNFVRFDRLPELLEKHSNWRARRILNTMGLPQFERMDSVAAALDAFWSDI